MFGSPWASSPVVVRVQVPPRAFGREPVRVTVGYRRQSGPVRARRPGQPVEHAPLDDVRDAVIGGPDERHDHLHVVGGGALLHGTDLADVPGAVVVPGACDAVSVLAA